MWFAIALICIGPMFLTDYCFDIPRWDMLNGKLALCSDAINHTVVKDKPSDIAF